MTSLDDWAHTRIGIAQGLPKEQRDYVLAELHRWTEDGAVRSGESMRTAMDDGCYDEAREHLDGAIQFARCSEIFRRARERNY
jgi:hypothetical protein